MKKILSVILTLVAFTQVHGSNVNWSSPPAVISNSSVNASDPQIAIDTSGNAVSVWVENNVIKASSKPVSGNWSSPVSISATNASSPALVSDANGNATAVWVENNVIKASTKPSGGNWSASTALSTSVASSPTLCVDSAGDVIAAWVKGSNIETSTKLFGGSWQAKVAISSSSASNPTIAIGGTGSATRAVIVWQGVSSGTNVIYTSYKLISGSWGAQQIISDTTHNATQPFVAVDNNTNAVAIWYAYDITNTSQTNVIVSSAYRSSATGSWSVPKCLSSPGLRNPSTLVARVAFDNAGNAIAFWNTSFDDENFLVQSAVRPVNGNWSSPVDLIHSNVYAYSVDLASTSYGDVLGLYMLYNGSSLLIQSVETDISGYLNNTWSVPITISRNSDNAFPKVAASISGNVIHAVAIWLNYGGTYTNVVASTGTKNLVLPPSSLAVSQSINHFGVFNEYYNTLTWNASTDPNVAGYLIFRNGVFLEQVGASVLHYVDNNRTLNGAVTYSVAALNNQGAQSASISVNFP